MRPEHGQIAVMTQSERSKNSVLSVQNRTGGRGRARSLRRRIAIVATS